jgi:hypothetical protein
MSTNREEREMNHFDDTLDDDEEICGETYDHDIVELGDGSWRCRRCDAEGSDDLVDEREAHA